MANVTEIRGVVYRSQSDAARALGVSHASICIALDRGRLQSVGLRMHGHRKPCYINGKRWPSQTAAARALGVTPAAVNRAVRSGRGYVKTGAGCA